LGDLRDAFKKAGLLGDKDERRLKHEERVQRKELGHEGLEQQQKREADERQRREQERRTAAASSQQRHDADRQRAERLKKLSRELEKAAVRTSSGPRRFHYRDADGHLPYLQVDDETGRRLEAGELAIVLLPVTDEPSLVPRALAAELGSFEPERVVHLAGATR